jgi:hypothetical protein
MGAAGNADHQLDVEAGSLTHPEELAKQASRRMDASAEFAAILRDAARSARGSSG